MEEIKYAYLYDPKSPMQIFESLKSCEVILDDREK